MGIVSDTQSPLEGIHSVAIVDVKSDRNSCVKKEKRKLERSLNPGSILTSAQLANYGAKWV